MGKQSKKSDTKKQVTDEVKPKRKYTKKNSVISDDKTKTNETKSEGSVDISNITFEEVTTQAIDIVSQTNGEIESTSESNVELKEETVSEIVTTTKEERAVKEAAKRREENLKSDQQRALDIISQLRDKIQFYTQQPKQENVETKKEEKLTEVIVPNEIEVANEINENPEENILEMIINTRGNDINHFELANTGIDISKFGMLEAEIGKYRLTRAYMGANWTVTKK